ncbi:hypothetical protein UFOVP233_1, partial [uncultured Caudovirales phage]
MSEAIYKIGLVFVLLLIWATAKSAEYNASEAHKHAHELACYVGDIELCKYHT